MFTSKETVSALLEIKRLKLHNDLRSLVQDKKKQKKNKDRPSYRINLCDFKQQLKNNQ